MVVGYILNLAKGKHIRDGPLTNVHLLMRDDEEPVNMDSSDLQSRIALGARRVRFRLLNSISNDLRRRQK